MATPSEDRQVRIVLNAFDTLFNKRDYGSAERFWSPRYIQHSAHIPPGREGLFDLVKSLPATLRYENHIAAATGDFVILHGRFSGHGLPAAWVVADIVRMEDGVLAERTYSVWPDLEALMRSHGVPQFTVDGHRPVGAFDLLGVSFSTELGYTNLLTAIDLAGVSLLRFRDDGLVVEERDFAEQR